MDHELDDGHTVFLGFAYPQGEQYTVAVYVDVNIGTRVKSGWEPLCERLGVAVPDEPFPSSNSTEEFQGRARSSE